MAVPLYVFDMDETLVNGDCAMIWNEFLVEKGIVTCPDFLKQDQHLMSLYSRGEMEMQAYLDFSIAPLAEISVSQIASLVEECIESRILPRVFPQALALIKQLKRDHIEMMVISASVTFLVSAVAKRLGIDNAIGVDLAIKNHRYLSQMIGTPSYQTGKVTRLNSWLANQDKHYSPIHFFTDSINDLPLCLHADHNYLVNPCEKLLEHGNRNNWQILEWG